MTKFFDIGSPQAWFELEPGDVIELFGSPDRRVKLSIITTGPATGYTSADPSMEVKKPIFVGEGSIEASYRPGGPSYVTVEAAKGVKVWVRDYVPSQIIERVDGEIHTDLAPRPVDSPELRYMRQMMKAQKRQFDEALEKATALPRQERAAAARAAEEERQSKRDAALAAYRADRQSEPAPEADDKEVLDDEES